MREIKFRAWVKESKKMENCIEVNPFYIGDCDRFRWKHEEVELMQYTGLKDKNGKDIYEGDILELTNEDGERVRAICKFGNRRLMTIEGATIDIQCFYFLIGDRKTNPIAVNYKGLHDLDIVEVKGNIYENPELIK